MSVTEQLLREIRDGIRGMNERVEILEQVLRLSVLQLPISPKTLNEMINAADIKGVSVMGVDKLTVAVPAGQQVKVVMPTRPGTVGVATGPINVTATYYSSGITATVLVDDFMVTSPDFQYTLTGEDSIELGQYSHYLQNMTVVVTNTTATDTTIMFRSEGLALEQHFFQTVYLPLLQYGYKTLADLAQRVGVGAR